MEGAPCPRRGARASLGAGRWGPGGKEGHDLLGAVPLTLLKLPGVLRRQLLAVGIKHHENWEPMLDRVAVPLVYGGLALLPLAGVHVDVHKDKALVEGRSDGGVGLQGSVAGGAPDATG